MQLDECSLGRGTWLKKLKSADMARIRRFFCGSHRYCDTVGACLMLEM